MPGRSVVRRVIVDAFGHFNYDDGWAMASHVALTTLMALFPFLIFATALASFLGSYAFVDTTIPVIFETWPPEIAKPIADEVKDVLTVQRGDLLTISVLAAAFFASNGVEALRTSLNRAYRQKESRSVFWLRLQSIGFVLVATMTLLAISVLLVAAPFVVRFVVRRVPALSEHLGDIEFWRYVIAMIVLVTGLAVSHLWLPCGRRRLLDIWPGILLTLSAWVVGSWIFVAYIDRFASYAATYAGLASIVVTLVFLYIVSAIFILGAELNAAIMRYRELRARIPR